MTGVQTCALPISRYYHDFIPIRIQANVNPNFKYLTTLILAILTLGFLFQIGISLEFHAHDYANRYKTQESLYCGGSCVL